ncbi:MAG: hypothetical protein QM743_13720 [Chitinophagaceae bacterium]
MRKHSGFLILLCCFLLGNAADLHAQFSSFSSGTASGTPRDTSKNKTNNSDWDETDAVMYRTRVFSERRNYRDTSLHTLHRAPFSQPWYRDLGNQGSPAMNLMFTPSNPVGLSLGYHTFDNMRWLSDSAWYYNTTRPYTNFTYHIGSTQEQFAEILHTQNIKPYWNVAFAYRKPSSPGYYYWQRNSSDNIAATTNYTAPGLCYKLYAAIVYNREVHDENGGIASDSFLTNPQYSDRKAIPVNFYTNNFTSQTRSPVQMRLRDVTVSLDHAYSWGRRDTTYSDDSTSYAIKLNTRFRISHHMEIGSQRYRYKDLRPDSLRYDPVFAARFGTNDSVYTQQEWFYADNRFLLNGFFGKGDRPWVFSAGAGNRIDQFKTEYLNGTQGDNNVSNYLTGVLRKEAVAQGQWDISAQAKAYLTGPATGNLLLDGRVSKDMDRFGRITIGAAQQLNNAPYTYTVYQNQYWQRSATFSKESTTQLFAMYDLPRWNLSMGARNYLLDNYLYFDAAQRPAQYGSAFSLSQFWGRKIFRLGHWVLDNELLYQVVPASAPVNVPSFMGRHQLSLETFIFKGKLQIATGVEVRYHSSYYAAFYSPFFNQFYYQNSYRVSNGPDGSVFFNFKIKRFRAFLMMDHVPQFFNKNIIITRGYTAQDAMIRFGFQWIMIN